jgi:Tfp pilus assembly protein PilX
MDLIQAEGKRKSFRKMRKNTMPSAKFASRGFTLIASLLLTLLLSGFAVALLMMVNTEQKVGAADLSNNYTYRAAEGAMEKMTSDLASTFQNIQAPTAAQICAVSNTPPTWDPTITFTGTDGAYNVTPVTPGSSTPCTSPLAPVWGPVQSGPDAGLYAQIIPVTMNVTAQRAFGNTETVSMTRTAEVALIPVFQFGIFSDSDLFFGQSPNLGFAGRVHTNGDIYLGVANGYNLVFGDKISAFGNVIREQMDNTFPVGGGWDQGTVMIPTTSNGCSVQMASVSTATPSATCVDISTTALGTTNGSVTGGHGSAQVAAWYNVSLGTPYNGYVIDGNGVPGGTVNGPNGTGADDLTLPFVNTSSGVSAIQIIRQPLATTSTTSLLGGSQLGYEAQIRVLLSDTQAGLHLADWNGDATQDIQLVGVLPTALAGLPQGASGGGSQALAVQVPNNAGGHYYYFGESYCAGTAATAGTIGAICPTTHGGDQNFIVPKYYGPMSPWASVTAFPTPSTANFTTANGGADGLEWPLVNGWLRVEAKWTSDGVWHGVTKEWLQLGFARGVNVPTQPGVGPTGTVCTSPATNTLSTAPGCNYLADHKNAILYLQATKDSTLNGAPSVAADYPITGAGVYYDTSAATHTSQYNWYPLNLYDAREGENNDVTGFGAGTGTPNGVMNVVELDVGNLRNWLLGKTGSTGTNVNFSTQDGYILYFSDRRGMQFATACGTTACQWQYGEYGYEDTVNYAAGSPYSPNGSLEPVNYNGVSPEDVNGNTVLDNYGVKGVGDAFGTQTTTDTDTTNPPSPYAIGHRLTLATSGAPMVGLANRVTGARHALKLVDGSLGNVPTMPPGNATNNCAQSSTNPTGCGGFTVGSENPVYILGNYNSNCPAAGGAGCTPNNATYDPTWGVAGVEPNHSAASVIADAITMLSNNWEDWGCAVSGSAICKATTPQNIGTFFNTTGSLVNPTNPATEGQTPNRFSATTYYRLAVAGGKTIAFADPNLTPDDFFGSDGGVHNFLRFLEDWSAPGTGGGTLQQLWYKGSIVSLYWNAYATGTFKCCNMVYHPPNRQYTFDSLFSVPQNLPPGTPMFRNVDNLSYRQNQVARTN